MRRLFTLLLVFSWVLPDATQAQCTKEIVLYLDVSGSMKPRVQDPTSPYWQTLSALGQVLEEPDFLGARDQLRVITFGRSLDPPVTAEGVQDIRLLLTNLRAQPRSDDYSDLATVFAHIANQPFDSVNFERQLVIVASDFVHEPSTLAQAPGLPAARYAAAFRSAFEPSKDALSEAFRMASAEIERRRLVLFVAPMNERLQRGGYGLVKDGIVADLRSTVGDSLQSYAVGADAGTVASLVDAIKRGFLYDLVVSGQANPATGNIDVTISNPNCVAIDVDDLRFQCLDDLGRQSGDAVRPASVKTPISIARTGRHVEPVPIDELTCPEDSRDYRVEVATSQGPAGSGKASRRNVLTYESEIASKEWSLVGTTLRVFVKMRGQILDERREYYAEIKANDRTPAYGLFSPPRNLQMNEDKTYMLLFSEADGGALRSGGSIQLQIRDADEVGERDIIVKPLRYQELEGKVSIAMVGLGFLAVFVHSLVRRDRPGETVAMLVSLGLSNGAALGIIKLLQMVRPGKGELVTWTSLWQNAAIGLALGMVAFFLVRQNLRVKARAHMVPIDHDAAEMGLDALEERVRLVSRDRKKGNRPVACALVVLLLYPIVTTGIRWFKSEPLTLDQQNAQIILVERDSP